MANNRRRHPRVKPKQLVSRVQGGEAIHLGLVVESLSVGGAFVRCLTPMKVGTRVALELHRQGASTPIPVTGVVASAITNQQAQQRKVSPGMGIAFDAMPPHVEARIEGIIGAIDPTALKADIGAGPTARLPSQSARELPAFKPRGSDEVPVLAARPPTREGIPVRLPTPSQPMRAISQGGLSPEVAAQLAKLLRQVNSFAEEIAKKDREIEKLRQENLVLRQMLERDR
jgi:Tfp pilus assembly protein PilZ